MGGRPKAVKKNGSRKPILASGVFRTPELKRLPGNLKDRYVPFTLSRGKGKAKYSVFEPEELRLEDRGINARKNAPATGKRGDGYPKELLYKKATKRKRKK